MIEWSDKYLTGNYFVDFSHKSLCRSINAFEKALAEEPGHYERLVDLLQDVTVAVLVHFRNEEFAMEDAGYPGLDEHREKHKQLRDAFDEKKHAFILFEASGEEVLDCLTALFVTHSAEEDRKFEGYILPVAAPEA